MSEPYIDAQIFHVVFSNDMSGYVAATSIEEAIALGNAWLIDEECQEDVVTEAVHIGELLMGSPRAIGRIQRG